MNDRNSATRATPRHLTELLNNKSPNLLPQPSIHVGSSESTPVLPSRITRSARRPSRARRKVLRGGDGSTRPWRFVRRGRVLLLPPPHPYRIRCIRIRRYRT